MPIYKMNFPPLVKQLFVASAPQLAAISTGGIVSFPGVLFHQLKANDSTIQLDVDATSWIGSTHGLGGTISCLVPLFMQYTGRKLTFRLSCLLAMIGWIIIYFAQSAAALIVAEMIHGLSSNSMLLCSLTTISEMVHPRYRIIAMNLFHLGQILGMNLVLLIGKKFFWRTVSLIECCPIVLAVIISFAWPESPEWLAYRGDFDKCKEAFQWLRGTDADADKALHDLIRGHKETIAQRKTTRSLKLTKHYCSRIWLKITRRDFYMPCLHMFVLICSIYWSGMMVIFIYTMDMLQQVTGSESAASVGVTVIYLILFLGNILGLVLSKVCNNKTIILGNGVCASFFMIAASVTSYLQVIEILPQKSLVCMYCLIGYAVSCSCGGPMCATSVSTEVMPIKHRGLGGALFIVLMSLLDFSALKLSPYLFLYINIWGSFLVYAVNSMLCMLFIWRFIPETKNRALHEIEEYFNYGHYVDHRFDDKVLENISDSSN